MPRICVIKSLALSFPLETRCFQGTTSKPGLLNCKWFYITESEWIASVPVDTVSLNGKFLLSCCFHVELKNKCKSLGNFSDRISDWNFEALNIFSKLGASFDLMTVTSKLFVCENFAFEITSRRSSRVFLLKAQNLC